MTLHDSNVFFFMIGWIDVTWDSGGSNSYRMGAEGKYDLQLAPSHDAEKLKPPPKVEQGAVGGLRVKPAGVATDKSKVSQAFRVRNRKIIFLFLNQNICCEYSKEPSQ